ncbi:MAG: methylhydantoinase [Acidiferrobacteraceae bacterium]|nr:methylhydantoinase [Acidiferrobacteraceae bacterium]
MDKDPITLEIIQNSLRSISDEMFAAMRKTAMSAIIYEVLDMGTAITTAEGELASSGAGIPAFSAMLDKSVRRIIELHGASGAIERGDIFITNDPFYGGVTHLNDVVLAMPVFSGEKLIAWTVNIAHWNDVGGMVPGSMSTEAKELFQEGLRLPGVKLISKGVVIEPVVKIIEANSRLPDFLVGDMWAGISAARLGERRILDLIQKYGQDVFESAITDYMTFGEQVSLAALKNLPKGRFQHSETQDDGVVNNVTIEITDTEFIVDLRDNPDQQGGSVNSSRDGVMVMAQQIFKSVTDPYTTCNGGTFRPLKLLTRAGSVFDAAEPCAQGFYFEVIIRVFDLMWRCLAPHVPQLPSGHFASICATIIGGCHPDTGRWYTIVEPELGGWGAADGMDGNTAVFSGIHGDTYNCPAEISEARYGVYVDRMELNPESGGEGEWRGGRGIRMDYRIRSNESFLTCGYTRSKYAPWPSNGGREGTPNYIEVIRKTGEKEKFSSVTGLVVDEDDVIRVITGAGGGFGEPEKRSPELIQEDLQNGYLTLERAREVYGYQIDA